MTTTAAPSSGPARPSASPSPSETPSAFDTIVAALADGDFDHIATVLADDASLTALLPRGPRRWDGAPAICEAFAGWFGELCELDVTDHGSASVGDLTQMQWRCHARGDRLGEGPREVEQHVFARLDADGRIQSMSLLCSGFQVEQNEV